MTVQTEPFSAGKAFLVLSVVNILSFPLTMIPFVITGVIQVSISLINTIIKKNLKCANKFTFDHRYNRCRIWSTYNHYGGDEMVFADH